MTYAIEPLGIWTEMGQLVRGSRVGKGLTAGALARALGVSAAFICDIEKGRRCFAPARWRDVGRVLDIDTADLAVLSGRMTPEAQAYVRAHPAAMRLLNEMAARNMSEKKLQALLHWVTR